MTKIPALILLATCTLAGVALLAYLSKSPDISVTDQFDSGRIANVSIDSKSKIRFSIPGKNEKLWFYFEVQSSEPISPQFVIENHSNAHQHGWATYSPVFSLDGKSWEKLESNLSNLKPSLFDVMVAKLYHRNIGFRFQTPFSAKHFWVAYSYPYTESTLNNYIDYIKSNPRVSLSEIGHGEQGRAIKKITIDSSNTTDKSLSRAIWIVAREHPGETPNSYALEGIISKLLDNPELFPNTVFHIIPLVNIDGIASGQYYRNTNGVDLAKDWDVFKSAELQSIISNMRPSLESGNVDLVLNLHSANVPDGHFFIKANPDTLPSDLAILQGRIFRAAESTHPHMNVDNSIEMWPYSYIAGNFFPSNYGVYCLYIEVNYSVGADGSRITINSLREFGAAMIETLNDVIQTSDLQ